jgi:hypothetical protein
VIVDGTLIYTDRVCTPGPTPGVDLWWSGKHNHHGGNIQVVSAPDGWPLRTSDVRPGREHDMTAAHADPELLARIAEWVSDGRLALSDLGYEGEPETFKIPFKKPKNADLTIDQQTYNAVHGALRCLGERANSLLKPPSRRCAATAAAPTKDYAERLSDGPDGAHLLVVRGQSANTAHPGHEATTAGTRGSHAGLRKRRRRRTP